MSTKFIVTIVRTITTEVSVDALNIHEALQYVHEYGVDLCAVDMGTQDAVETKIKCVRLGLTACCTPLKPHHLNRWRAKHEHQHPRTCDRLCRS